VVLFVVLDGFGFLLGSVVMYLWISHRTSAVKYCLGGCWKLVRWIEWLLGIRGLEPCNRPLVIVVIQYNLVNTTLVYTTSVILRHIFARPAF